MTVLDDYQAEKDEARRQASYRFLKEAAISYEWPDRHTACFIYDDLINSNQINALSDIIDCVMSEDEDAWDRFMDYYKETWCPEQNKKPAIMRFRNRDEKAFRSFDGMAWAVPGECLDDLEWMLRYEEKDTVFTMNDRVVIASFLDCYRELIKLPERERNKRIRELRKGPN